MTIKLAPWRGYILQLTSHEKNRLDFADPPTDLQFMITCNVMLDNHMKYANVIVHVIYRYNFQPYSIDKIPKHWTNSNTSANRQTYAYYRYP
jgi:hypothetical protein